MSALDLVIILLYLGLSLGAGLVLSRRAGKGLKEYFLSGSALPWWLAGLSMAAGAFNADTPQWVTGIVRRQGIGGNWFWWNWLVTFLFGAFVLARLWRRVGVLTDLELTELRYDGRPAGVLRGVRAGLLGLVFNVVGMAISIKGIANLLAIAFGIADPLWVIAATLAVVLVYSSLAGLWGAVITDAFQLPLALAGSLLIAWFAVDAVGGIGALNQRLAQLPVNPLNLIYRDEGSAFWQQGLVMFGLALTVQWWAFINADGGGKVIQRINACKNERHAARAMGLFVGVNYFVVVWPWLLAALCSLVLLPAATHPELAYARLIVEVVPGGFKGFLVASFLAAFMSTIQAQLNWGASYAVHDLYRRFLDPAAPERRLVRLSRVVVAVSLAAAAVLALAADSINVLMTFLVALGVGVGPVYLLRWFWWRINAWTEISAMAVSVTVASVLSFLGHPFYLRLLITLGAAVPVWLAVTFLTRPTAPDKLEAFYRRALPPGCWGPVAARCPDLPPPPRLWPKLLLWLGSALLLFALLLSCGWLLGLRGFTWGG